MSSKRNITYKCPYCDKRFNKENLVIHIGDVHDDMIPEGYSAFRVVFDYVNKRPAGYNGKCIICGNESGWDEEKGKYNRICSNPSCKKKYIESFEQRMIKAKGVKRISSTAEGQVKMLANRKISGKYRFKDGVYKTYTGTYERKALEFMDKVMNIKSEDVSTPGPVMEYEYEGKKHIYISDIYYAPYNLIIEVKDGGNNPNNRDMKSYREKQIEKEKYIINNTDFNYLRLTNNDFSQLLAAFMQLKMEMSSDSPERVIRINEGIITDKIEKPYKYGETKKINEELANKINSTNYPWYFIHVMDLDSGLGFKQSSEITLYGYSKEPINGADKSDSFSHILYNKKINHYFSGKQNFNPALRKFTTYNKGAAKTKDIVLKENYIEEASNSLEFKSDEDLLDWMYKNIKYSNFTKLKSHDEVLKSKKGSCHDQVMFEYVELKKLGYSPRGLFIIESNDKNQGGMTHSLVYYKRENSICWFENAWKNMAGITEPEEASVSGIKKIIKELHENGTWGNIKKYPKIEFSTFSISSHKPGESLQQFIDICLKNINESYIEEASTGLFKKIQKDPEIVETYGFVSSNNIYNENVKIKGFNKWLRGRSELLIIDKDKVYLKKDNKGYSIPGGGWEKDEDHNLSAIRETNEEARIKVKNVSYVGSYASFFEPKDWVKERISEENWWYGEYTELYIGEYDGEFKGHVDKIDQDKKMESGKFYDIKSVYKDLISVHQEALDNIIKEDTYMTEAMNALMTGYIPGSVDNPNNTYIVNYMQNNVFSEEDPNEDCIGVSDSPLFKNLIIRDKDNVLKKVDESFLKDKTYNVYIVEKSIEEVSKLLAPYMNKEVEFGFLYETMTGKKLYTKDQVGLEGVLIPAMDYYEYMKEFKEICDNYFSAKDKRPVEINEVTCIPKEVRHFSKSGLMQTEKVYTLNEYINSKPSKVLECLDIQVKEV